MSQSKFVTGRLTNLEGSTVGRITSNRDNRELLLHWTVSLIISKGASRQTEPWRSRGSDHVQRDYQSALNDDGTAVRHIYVGQTSYYL